MLNYNSVFQKYSYANTTKRTQLQFLQKKKKKINKRKHSRIVVPGDINWLFLEEKRYCSFWLLNEITFRDRVTQLQKRNFDFFFFWWHVFWLVILFDDMWLVIPHLRPIVLFLSGQIPFIIIYFKSKWPFFFFFYFFLPFLSFFFYFYFFVCNLFDFIFQRAS